MLVVDGVETEIEGAHVVDANVASKLKATLVMDDVAPDIEDGCMVGTHVMDACMAASRHKLL